MLIVALYWLQSEVSDRSLYVEGTAVDGTYRDEYKGGPLKLSEFSLTARLWRAEDRERTGSGDTYAVACIGRNGEIFERKKVSFIFHAQAASDCRAGGVCSMPVIAIFRINLKCSNGTSSIRLYEQDIVLAERKIDI